MMHKHLLHLLLSITALFGLPHYILADIFINCGGENYTDVDGNLWVADSVTKVFNTGEAFTAPTAPISGTDDDILFLSQRWDHGTEPEMKYAIPLVDGDYNLTLHFSETYEKAMAPNKRVFDVRVGGSQPIELERIDIFAQVGGFAALTKSVTTFVSGGVLTIEFRRGIQNPSISGIEIHKLVINQAVLDPNYLQAEEFIVDQFDGPTTHVPSSMPSPMPSTLVSFDPILINGGGDNYTDVNGILWVADTVTKYFNTGMAFKKNSTINGTKDEVLYQSERYDVFNGPHMKYTIPIPNGTYDLFLHFAEMYTKTQAPKQRVFDVYVQNKLVYGDFDIFMEAGGYTALVKKTIVTVMDGFLTIKFDHKIRDPKICAIEIRASPLTSAPLVMPSISSQPSAPTNSPIPSVAPSRAPIMFPSEISLPWLDMDGTEGYTARHEGSFVQAGNKFYMFGGRESPAKLDIYDYTHSTWTQGAMAPKHEEPQENVYVYDPANDVWMDGPEIPRKRGAGGLVVYNDKFYLVGGSYKGHDGGFVPWMDENNPVTGEWIDLADAPHSRDHFHAAVLGDRLYAVGGRRTVRGNTLGDTVKEVDVYDVATRQWLTTELPMDIPLPRALAAVAVYAGKVMVIGGETAWSRVAHDRVDALDPTNGRRSSLTPLNHRRHGMQAIVSGEGVYVAGGLPNRGGGGQQKRMEVYNVDSPEGEKSRPGRLGVYFGSGGLVTLQHIGGNQAVFVNSIVLTGRLASDFKIKTQPTSRILIRKSSLLTLTVEYTGAAQEARVLMVVTYSRNKALKIPLTATRNSKNKK